MQKEGKLHHGLQADVVHLVLTPGLQRYSKDFSQYSESTVVSQNNLFLLQLLVISQSDWLIPRRRLCLVSPQHFDHRDDEYRCR